MNQAQRIIRKFGGAYALAKALMASPNPDHHRHWSVIYRWERPYGTNHRGGRIPPQAWPGVLAAARQYGIYLSDEDCSPRESADEETADV